jgi:hypothetical protein
MNNEKWEEKKPEEKRVSVQLLRQKTALLLDLPLWLSDL